MTVGLFDGVLYGAPHVVVPFVASRIDHLGPRGFGPLENLAALGVVRGDRLIGGVVYGAFRDIDVEVSIAFDDPRWARRRVLERLFRFPFIQLGCRRITALVAADDPRTLKLMRGIGWTQEGRHRCALDGTRDALSFGMLREDCRWLDCLHEVRPAHTVADGSDRLVVHRQIAGDPPDRLA